MNDVGLFMSRGDFLEETFYSFSYSPIRDESGNVGGLFCPSPEVASKILNTRRLRTLSELAAESLVKKSIEGASASAISILGKNRDEVPFGLLYLVDAKGECGLLEQKFGISNHQVELCPPRVPLSQAIHSSFFWQIPKAESKSEVQLVSLDGFAGWIWHPNDA